VLEYLSTHGSSGVVEIGKALQLQKSTAHRMLLSLKHMGFVTQEEASGKYELTFKIVRISNQFLAKLDMAALIHPYMEQLANRCQETVHLVQRMGCDVVYIDKVEPMLLRDSSIRMASRIGLVRPMYCSGVGKAILAELSEEEVLSIWNNSQIEKKTENTIVSLEQLTVELEQIKECRYALDNEENEIGVRCIAASISDYNNKSRYAFSISAPSNRMTNERISELSAYVLQIRDELNERIRG
jgi:DNA-binding IclR family transcriptional regulator